MVIEGEVKEKVYSVIADSIDVLRLYQSTIELWKATKDENYRLVDENDRLKDKVALLERFRSKHHDHMVKLEAKNTQLLRQGIKDTEYRDAFEIACRQMKEFGMPGWVNSLKARLCHADVDVKIPDEEPNEGADNDPEVDTKLPPSSELEKELTRQVLESIAELEKYKAAARVLSQLVNDCLLHKDAGLIQSNFRRLMKEEGYDIEKPEHKIEGFGDPGCKDNSEGADEHDFL
jgi:hypothetical protein